VANPQTAATIASGTYRCQISTSTDAKWFYEATARVHGAGSATQIIVANGEIGEPGDQYSDDATMINMLSGKIYVTMADQYGNAKDVTGDVTVSLSSSPSGTFYTNADAGGDPSSGLYSAATSITCDEADPTDGGQQVYYKGSTAEAYTLTFSADSYDSATWVINLAPAISLYDKYDNLINTYGATSTSYVAELNDSASDDGAESSSNYIQKYGADYINSAITAAMTGDTIKLGDGTYELDAAISLDEAITLTSVNGASSTTLRNTANNFDQGITVGASGTATNPLIIDGFTFQRLRVDYDFERAVYSDGYDYVTVRNCIFNYIEPDVEFDSATSGGVIVIGNNDVAGAITSATVSNNTFNNCCTTWPDLGSGAKAAVIGIIARYQHDTSGETGYPITGVTVSGNTLTDCGGIGIGFNGYAGPTGEYSALTYVTGSITNNTITNGFSAIQVERNSTSVSVTGNTITGAYSYGVKLSGTTTTSMVIKNNTITDTVGSSNGAGIRIQTVSGVVPAVQYNDITGSNTYAIKSDSVEATSCQYNWYGDASGPNYTALAGANIAKSNPNGAGDKITDYVTYYPWLYKSKAYVVTDNVSYQTCTMKLVLGGWNTLSTPVQLIESADAIDELISADDMSIGYYYDAGWQLIETGKVLSPCDAVYIKMKSTASTAYLQFKFDAGAYTTPSKDLAVGWNLISLSDLTVGGMDTDDAVTSVYKSAAGLPGYSQVVSPSLNAAQYDMYYTAGTAFTVTMAEHATATGHAMLPGLGYWIYMQNAATLAGFTITPIVPDLD